jgi:hypothetical protein
MLLVQNPAARSESYLSNKMLSKLVRLISSLKEKKRLAISAEVNWGG